MKIVLIIYMLLNFMGRIHSQSEDLTTIIQTSIDQQTSFPQEFLEEEYHDQLIQIFSNFKKIPETKKRYRYYRIVLAVRNSCSNSAHRIILTRQLLQACGDPSRAIARHYMEMIDLESELEDFDTKNIDLICQLFDDPNVDVSRLYRIALDLPIPKQHQIIQQQFQELLKKNDFDITKIEWPLFRTAIALASRGSTEATNYLLAFANHQLASAEKGGNWMDVAAFLKRTLLYVPQKRITNLFIDQYLFSDYKVIEYGYSDFDIVFQGLQYLISDLNPGTDSWLELMDADDLVKATRHWFLENRDSYTYSEWILPKKMKK